MKRFSRLLVAFSLLFVAFSTAAFAKDKSTVKPKKGLRLLYWNIQNGMWSGQADNYNAFVKWVKAQRPDVCVWCEGQSIYQTGTAKSMKPEDRYLPGHWQELAARYGHKYIYVGGHRDNFPQVITSRYPINNVARITGEGDSIVMHGAGWATIEANGRKVNIVTLHTWPQAYSPTAKDHAESARKAEGDKYRRMEIEYIYRHTLGSVPGEANDLWMMMGDFNSVSPLDNNTYGYTLDSSKFLVQNFVLGQTPYMDVVSLKHPGEFLTSIGRQRRIDFVYCTRPLYERVVRADIITDDYTRPVLDEQVKHNFWHPSDHRPIIVDFEMK